MVVELHQSQGFYVIFLNGVRIVGPPPLGEGETKLGSWHVKPKNIMKALESGHEEWRPSDRLHLPN